MIRVFRKFHNIHFVGIGGTGMSGIAEVLVNMGFQVTGSDLLATEVTEHLKSLGCQIFQGHDPDNIGQAQVVVYSSAVTPENVELRAARDKHIPIIPRAEMLGELMRLKFGIAVAGTHGKTTTTSMAAEILSAGGLDPTIIVGGRLRSMKSGAKMGLGPVLIAEADEFDRSFLKLFPDVAVITTLETEHLDCYRDLEDIKDTFVDFSNKVPFFGSVILCMDEPAIRDIEPRVKRPVVHYGLSISDGLSARNIQFERENSTFTAYYSGDELGQVQLQVPGIHNVRNSLAAIAVGLEMDIEFPVIQKALNRFSGVHRRFDIKGEAQGILVVDDYGHHPTEIRATLEAARQGWNRRIVAIFQPHLYSRTRDFHKEFGEVFLQADVLRVMEIYAARERPIEGVNGDMVSRAAREAGHPDAGFCPTHQEVLAELEKICKSGDMVITFGAGDVGNVANEFFKRLGGGNKESSSGIPDWRVPV
jgi:UDP-N-acetylmuramate--alanine ligase